jgi:Restriction endonuclease
MQDKERLLDMAEPLQFIFSHSALREGWDNPNVFQICTLNETQSQMKKRQEIGRGLRLAVNQQGERIHDKSINVLTVIPNESYEVFARTLQQEIEDETDVSFKGRVKNARAKARVQRKALSAEDEALFKAIWQRINYQTRYSVTLDELLSNLVYEHQAASLPD